jgi:enediyne biosynthesis protein E4
MAGKTPFILAGLAAVFPCAGGPGVALDPPRPPFEDATRAAGLDFVYRNGMNGALHLPEIMGGGAALFDFDGDGDLDLYCVQGGSFGPHGEPTAGPEHDRLWLNEPAAASSGHREPRFIDVSAVAGLSAGGYGMGVTAGDYDNDGWTDIFVTGYGSARLLRNQAGRRLEDVTARAGLADAGWSVSAAFVDLDRDGWLDLFVPRYVDYTPVRCRLPSSRPDYCGPRSFPPQSARVFRNRGDGTFEDATERLLGPHRAGPGLGVVVADLDEDGWADAYVANDGSDNHLWLNRGGRSMREEGLLAGVALNRLGLAEAGMGVDAGDVDGDLDLDLFVTNLTGETNTLYLNQGAGLFQDATAASGLGPPSLPLTGFGTRLLDYDNDGWLDVVVVDGAVHLSDPPPGPADPFPLAQPKLLFRNVGHGRFADLTRAAGEPFTRPEVSRGLAAGDVDNDGDVDLVLVNQMAPARLILNRVGQDAPWIGLRLVTRDGRRDALGARVRLRRRNAPDMLRHAHADGSYASASDPRVLFGLAGGADVTGLEVRWPDGAWEEFEPPERGRYTVVRQGTGRAPSPGRRP